MASTSPAKQVALVTGASSGMGKETVKRQLAEESVGFQEMLSEVRQVLAQHYLRRTDISAGEISWLLGFQESNSFIRVFRSWTGNTPTAYRQGRSGLGSDVH